MAEKHEGVLLVGDGRLLMAATAINSEGRVPNKHMADAVKDALASNNHPAGAVLEQAIERGLQSVEILIEKFKKPTICEGLGYADNEEQTVLSFRF